jgi:perosamine synthetase
MSDFIPYGRQVIEEDDIAAVVEVLRGSWLTGGPGVERFEADFAEFTGAPHAVAVSSGTAALHLAMLALGISPGDEVIVPTMTFAASANAVRYCGGTVVFADSRPDTLAVDPEHVASLVNPRTRAVVVVDYAGIPADLDALIAICERAGVPLIEDACHAPGAMYKGRRIGNIADVSTFSFHPVKHLTTGEGGMVTCRDTELAARIRMLRNHGIASNFRQREQAGTWEYDVAELGFNYRLPEIACALGISQLRKVPAWVDARRRIADRYRELLEGLPVRLLTVPGDRVASWHLFPVLMEGEDPEAIRLRAFRHMRASSIGVNVHYRPVHHHTIYRASAASVVLPVAEDAYSRLLSLPMWPGLSDALQDRVVEELADCLAD